MVALENLAVIGTSEGSQDTKNSERNETFFCSAGLSFAILSCSALRLAAILFSAAWNEVKKSNARSEERGQTSSFFSLPSSSFISFSTSSLTFLIFTLVSGRKTTFPTANRSTRAKAASTRGRISSGCLGMLMSRMTRLEECFWVT